MVRRGERGFTLIEMLIGLAVTLLAMGGLTGMLIQSSRLNKSQQMTVDVQANARNSLGMVTRALRSAGWDPLNVGIPTVVLDPDLSDDVSVIEIHADYNEDGTTAGPVNPNERVSIRHNGNVIEQRETDSPLETFKVMAINITNDANADGVIEPMFVPDAVPPTRITVQITARSPIPDPVTGQFIRHTVRSIVVLRKTL